jgi:hypothetical protein
VPGRRVGGVEDPVRGVAPQIGSRGIMGFTDLPERYDLDAIVAPGQPAFDQTARVVHRDHVRPHREEMPMLDLGCFGFQRELRSRSDQSGLPA